MVKTFVSYTRPYDHHKGSKDWSVLSQHEQDCLIKAELSSDPNLDVEALVMKYDWKKCQAEGFRTLNVCASLLLEEVGIIPSHNIWDKNHIKQFLTFYEGTKFEQRIRQVFEPLSDNPHVALNGSEFELFADFMNYDDIHTLPYNEARAEMIEDLEKTAPPTIRYEQPSVKSENGKLDNVFDKVLISKGVFPNMEDNHDFPFDDFDEFSDEIKTGRVNLSFGMLNPTSFNVVASTAEEKANLLSNVLHMFIAPLILIIGAMVSENYWILLVGVAYFPLLTFGTHPTYKKAPFWIIVATLFGLYALGEENIALAASMGFLGTVMTGCALSRWHYNRVLLKHAFKNEKALIFLLASGALNLCNDRYELIWESPIYR